MPRAAIADALRKSAEEINLHAQRAVSLGLKVDVEVSTVQTLLGDCPHVIVNVYEAV